MQQLQLVSKNVPCFESISLCGSITMRLAEDRFAMCLREIPRVSLQFISYYGNCKMETLLTISLVILLQYFTITAAFLEDICPCTNEEHCRRPAPRNKSIGSLQVRRHVPCLVSVYLRLNHRCKSFDASQHWKCHEWVLHKRLQL